MPEVCLASIQNYHWSRRRRKFIKQGYQCLKTWEESLYLNGDTIVCLVGIITLSAALLSGRLLP